MHQSGREQIVSHLATYEGNFAWMCLDNIGLVTTGIGALLDPLSTYANKMRFVRKDTGKPATAAEVKAEFDMVKSKRGANGKPLPDFAQAAKFGPITQLRVTPESVEAAVLSMLPHKEGECVSYFGQAYYTFPADVQMVLVQMSYGGGLLARRAQLAPLLKRRDFVAARDFTFLSNPAHGKGDYRRHNAAFRLLMINGFILEACSKKKDMPPWIPTDISIFYGVQRTLELARWTTGPVTFEVRDDDVVTERNYQAWVDKQATIP